MKDLSRFYIKSYKKLRIRLIIVKYSRFNGFLLCIIDYGIMLFVNFSRFSHFQREMSFVYVNERVLFMKIAVIQASSQKEKNLLLYQSVQNAVSKKDDQVVNFGIFQEEEAARKQRDTKLLKEINHISKRTLVEIFPELSHDLIKSAVERKLVMAYIMGYGTNEDLKTLLQGYL